MCNKKIKLLTTSLLLIVTTSLFTACSSKESSSQSTNKKDSILSDIILKDEDTKTVTSTDGVCSITTPSDWKENLALNPIANIIEGSPLQDQFIMTISESTVDFADNFSLEDYYNAIQENMSLSVTNSEITNLGDVSINGLNCMQFQLNGEVQGVKLSYIITIAKSENHFHQIIAWTLQSSFNDKKDELNEIINTFKVL